MRRLLATMAIIAVLASATAGITSADGNHPPVAVDDPPVPCGPFDHWGGSFPLVEDYWEPHNGAGWEDWFVWFGDCSPIANDYDPDGDPLTLELVGQPAHGEAVWTPEDPHMLGYRVDREWSTLPGDVPGGSWVSDEIQYQLFDGQASSGVASFRVWVAPINDAPSFTPGPAQVEASAGGGAVSLLWATDISPGPANEASQTVSFDVDSDTPGEPSIFAVKPTIDTSGVLTFTPGPDAGIATVRVQAHDDGGLDDWGLGSGAWAPPEDTGDPVTFTIVLLPPAPAPPTAVDDVATVIEDTPVSIPVLENDSDRNGDPLTITGVSDPDKGSATIDAAGDRILYAPGADANGVDSFDYSVNDGVSGSSSATVSITIEPRNDAPVAGDDEAGVDEGADATAIDVLANDTDVDGDSPTVSAAGPAPHGTVTFDAGVVRYRPDAGYAGLDSFSYTIDDGHGARASARVDVTVAPDAGPPVVGTLSRTIATGKISTGTVRLRLGWSATDAGSGVAGYQVQQRRDGGSWRPVPLASSGSRSAVVELAAGHRYEQRVRASDGRGNVSAWSAWTAIVPGVTQETSRSVTWTGTWHTGWSAAMLGGRDRWTSLTGRRSVFTLSGHAVGWVGRRSTSGGSAEVRIDGKLVATVSCRASVTLSRYVLFSTPVSEGGSHRIEIRPLGNGRVDIDGFIVLP